MLTARRASTAALQLSGFIDYLVTLEIYDESNAPCIRYVAKRTFLHDVMVETDARAIATRFYPIAGREPAAGSVAGDA